ncbi:MAG: hypothetical protein WHT65_05740 [Pseudothermotoga sp.]
MKWIKQSKFLQATLLIVLLGLLGWLSPFFPLKVIVAFLGILVFAFVLKEYVRHIVGFIVLSIVLFLVPSTGNYYSHIILENFENWFNLPFVTETFREVGPSRTVELARKVLIEEVANVDIHFVEGNQIRLPEELSLSSYNDQLRISGGFPKRRYVIEIGTQGLRELNIDGTAISLRGNCEIELLNIDGTAINLKGNMLVKRLFLDGTGVNMSGDFQGESLYTTGTGINLKGKISFETVRIDGTGISFDLTLVNCRTLTVDGTGVSGKIVNAGSEKLFLRASGTGGKITLINQSNADISIESSGIKIVRE